LEDVWYIAQLKPRAERIAEQNLLRQGFRVFAPKIQRTFRRKGKFRTELQAIFPGYLLVRSSSHAARWRAIGSTAGVRRLVTFGENGPAALPAHVVDTLKAHYGDPGSRGDSHPRKGDAVRVISGPFSDFVARVEMLPAKDRICVLLDVMGQHTRVSMAILNVIPI
jgi:transcriptional antiterminator RfaH